MKYEIIDHTADVCIRVYGKSIEELFKNAATAMMELITDTGKVDTSQTVEIKAEGETLEELLVHWLEEILYIHQVKKMVFKDFEIINLSRNQIVGKALGENIDPDKHDLHHDIKAVTYHNLRIENLNDKLKVDIVFDI
mgnify:FL=1|jgi:SHS2 domain-containing protein